MRHETVSRFGRPRDWLAVLVGIAILGLVETTVAWICGG